MFTPSIKSQTQTAFGFFIDNRTCSVIRSLGSDRMTTKEKLLELFEANRGVYFSGEEIAQSLSVSRSAVWKAVKSLQEQGYAISAVTNKGYSLSVQTDILSIQGIQKYLRPEIAGMNISVLSHVSSTNAVVREKANLGEPEGFLTLANEQTSGRGRLGRSFFSPPGTGLYMSLLLRPQNYAADQAVKITTMAAVAMSEAVEAVSGEKVEIKWVNDLYLRGKKICGILTEGSFSLENGALEYAVLGVGVNVYPPEQGFPQEFAETAGSVFTTRQNDAKNRLAAEFLNSFYRYYTSCDQTAYVEQYRGRSSVIGKRVTLLSGQEKTSAFVLGIDDQCRLLVQYDDGKKACYSSGEIRIRF